MIQGTSLPDEMVEEILSRARMKCVLRCRSVSKHWKALISTPNFGLLRHKNHNRDDDLTLLVEERIRPPDSNEYYNSNYTLKKKRYTCVEWQEGDQVEDQMLETKETRIIDAHPYEWKEEEERESNMHVCFSSCGLVVLYSKHIQQTPFSTEFLIFNPITGEKVKVNAKDTDDIMSAAAGQIYGVFFHSVLKEFCILWGKAKEPSYLISDPPHRSVLHSFVGSFQLLNLGPSPSRWKDINNQSTARILNQHYRPRLRSSGPSFFGAASPVVLGHVLYWMAEEANQIKRPNPRSCHETIMAFDTIREVFELLPHPGPLPCSQDTELYSIYRYNHRFMHLLEYNNHLSVFQTSATRGYGSSFDQHSRYGDEWLFNIWIFERDDNHHEPGIDDWWQPSSRLYGVFMCAHRYTFIPIRNSDPEILLP